VRTWPDTRVLNFVFKCRFRHNLTVGCVYELIKSNQIKTLPDAPTTTAPAEKDGWKTVEGKAAQKKRRNDKADDKRAATTANHTPKTTNGGRGKNTHQP
jgi:hypothetical protein